MNKNLLADALSQVAQEAITSEASPNPKDEKTKREDEIVFYARMSNPDGLKLADSKESHEQWEIKTTLGRVRVRKTTKDGLNPTYDITFKVKSSNAGIEGSEETTDEINQVIFDSFKGMALQGMIKDRYKFPVSNVEVTTNSGRQDIHVQDVFYEVDVFFNEDGSYNENVKIDLEMNAILDAINKSHPNLGEFNLNVKLLGLPFKPFNVLISDKNATEETKKKITELYDSVFLTKK